MTHALEGIKIVDISGIGAYASMILADFGAEVTRVSAILRRPPRPRARRGRSAATSGPPCGCRRRPVQATHRGNRDISINLKSDEGRAIVQALAREADVFLESFRPGVCDRLGVGYAELSARNPRLVYASLTGYGQTGPYRDRPGHDLNYIALGGALGMLSGEGGRPYIPLNILADFAGGGLYTALGICLALLARDRTGRGQHVDMAMSDGVLSLLTAVLMDKIVHDEDVHHRGNTSSTAASPTTTPTAAPTDAGSPSPAWRRTSTPTSAARWTWTSSSTTSSTRIATRRCGRR